MVQYEAAGNFQKKKRKPRQELPHSLAFQSQFRLPIIEEDLLATGTGLDLLNY